MRFHSDLSMECMGDHMGKEYILAVDQSTSGTKTMVVDSKGEILAKSAKGHAQYYPESGWVEHDPMEIYENVKLLLKDVVSKCSVSPVDLDVLAVTNQRETVVIWDKTTGVPVYNAIVWLCRRTADFCGELKNKGFESMIKEKTGLIIDPYFSASKIRWILDHVPGAREKAARGELLFGNIDSWLIWKLTGGKSHTTDFSNASRTMLFNIKTLQWDKELLELFGIPVSMLPQVRCSDEIFGQTKAGELFDESLPIAGVIGDSQGALFGQQCFEVGMAKATYGTGSFILMNTGKHCMDSRNGLVTTIAWGVQGEVSYAFEGIVHCTGDTLKWLKENLGMFRDFSEMEEMMNAVSDNGNVYVVPAFSGLGIPYWDAYARAAIVGMSRGSNKNHIVRAAVESIAYQVKDAVEVVQTESAIKLKELRADGGPTTNRFLMQFQADLLDVKIAKSEVAELSAMGACYLAGLAVGIWKSVDEIKQFRKAAAVYTPNMDAQRREKYYAGWKDAVSRVLTK
ncbi:MAG: glycerol kinase GlpK [Oscillospiraceae bacterium]